MATIDTIAKTLASVATIGMKQKDLFAAVRESTQAPRRLDRAPGRVE